MTSGNSTRFRPLGQGVLGGLALAWMIACGPAEAPPAPGVDPRVLATFTGGSLAVEDLDHYLLSLPPGGRRPGPSDDPTTWLEGRLHILFERRSLATAEALAALEADAGFAQAWDRRRRALLARAYLLRHNVQLEVTAEEVKAYFEAHRAEMTLPERRSFRNLLLKTDPTTLAASGQTAADVCRRAEELRQQAKAGASFEQLVLAHSQSANAAAGGVVGMLTRPQLRKEVGDLLFALEPGEVSTVLENAAGCQIFQLIQAVPPVVPNLELQADGIVKLLADQKRSGVYRRLLRDEAKKSGAALPSWLGGGPPKDLAADAVLFEHAGQRLLAREVVGESGMAAAEAVETAIGELLFAAAEERDLPATSSSPQIAEERLGFAADFLRQKAVMAHVRAVPEAGLRAFYEQRKTSYLSEPKLEATVYSWPIGKGDPLSYLAVPEAMVRELNLDPKAAAQAWSRHGAGARREDLPQMTLRQLMRQRPQLTPLLAGELAEGLAVGPSRAGGRLYVLAVNLYVPERPLGFVEVRERLQGDYAVDRGLAEWGEAWRRERSFTVYKDHLKAFGATLVERLKGPRAPTGAAAPAAPSPAHATASGS